ncbi:hypothetical protein FNJ88_06325 [Chryseobacterium sp. SNU WT5]|uniref:hypothetical protein n=1 Tax=Chryseobacterium sp. SNU WT5 TaxID=2594269 RepID=UPI00117E3FE4|nr:hypothetical protein [Chryseobacterium sp. SNU WT5]QDP85198.1 hypothetical protein FNJ88_06325 [Chryseobacterium sp. SNU WT5]
MSKDTFKNHPDLQEYFETSDGTKFYKEDLAKNHARTLEDKAVTAVSRPEEAEVKKPAAEILELIPDMDIDDATEFLMAENLLAKPRKSVVEALTAHLEELQK